MAKALFSGLVAGALAAAAASAGPAGEILYSRSDERGAMVEQIADYSRRHKITDSRVLEALRRVPRHLFMPKGVRSLAYANRPLPIGHGQTISQPFIVAYMTQALGLSEKDRVLEIGTGSGYQAAVLAEIAAEVYSIEIVEPLGRRAKNTLGKLGYSNIHVRLGDGYRGWPEAAPFDAVIVTCAPEDIPAPLVNQLKDGGWMIIPVGAALDGKPWAAQELVLVRKTSKGMERVKMMDVRFVPMTGEALEKKSSE